MLIRLKNGDIFRATCISMILDGNVPAVLVQNGIETFLLDPSEIDQIVGAPKS